MGSEIEEREVGKEERQNDEKVDENEADTVASEI